MRKNWVRCDTASSCGSVIAVFHTVINDNCSERLAAQLGAHNRNNFKFERRWRFELNGEVGKGLEATRVVRKYAGRD